MKTQTREEPEILAAAERKMHAWAMNLEQAERADRFRAESHGTEREIRFVAISREAGAGGSEIGKMIGEKLGWEVFDKNLLDQMAGRFRLPRMMLDLVDETSSSWVYDVLGTWMDREIVPHEKFAAFLTRMVLAAQHRGHIVFVGRGAQFLLPRPEVLAVRLVASPEYRVRQIMARTGLSQSDARQQMNDLDRGRREFALRFFHHDITDPLLYDMVINVERRGKVDAVREILAVMAK